MMPISNYRDLIKTLGWSRAKSNAEGWCLFLIMNPRNQTDAGVDIINNLPYLNDRTGNITFFLPGFSNSLDGKILPYPSRNEGYVVYRDEFFGKLYFDRSGFLNTIKWLEEGCSSYRYSEGLDLVIIKYRSSSDTYELNFDLQNMIYYNLDYLKYEKINVLRMITKCMEAVSISETENEVKQKLNSFISVRDSDIIQGYSKEIKVFIAGSTTLREERDAVTSVLTCITNDLSKGYVFRVKTYESFDRSLTDEGRQQDYNDYIANEADYAIFILDGNVGGITMEEFREALKAYNAKRKPEIYVYSHKINNRRSVFDVFRKRQSEDIIEIRRYLSEIGQYYIVYQNVGDLRHHVFQDFASVLLRRD